MARLKGAAPEIKKRLAAEIKSATKPLEDAAKQNVLAIQSRGAAGGGVGERSRYNDSRVKSGRSKQGSGLREGIARGVTRKITYSGYKTGVRVRADGKYLPESQRALIKATNKGTVRHPVFGNRSSWTTQQFTPDGWFDRATREHGPEAIRKIKEAARRALRELG